MYWDTNNIETQKIKRINGKSEKIVKFISNFNDFINYI